MKAAFNQDRIIMHYRGDAPNRTLMPQGAVLQLLFHAH